MVRRAGRLVLTERPTRPGPAETERSFARLLQERGTAVLPWNTGSRRLLERARFFARAHPGRAPGDFSEAWLVEHAPKAKSAEDSFWN